MIKTNDIHIYSTETGLYLKVRLENVKGSFKNIHCNSKIHIDNWDYDRALCDIDYRIGHVPPNLTQIRAYIIDFKKQIRENIKLTKTI